MKTINTILLCALLLGIIFAGCKEESTFNPAPQITFVQVEPSNVIEYQDSLTITIMYRDEDGDLGENDPDVINLFMKDTRNNVIYEYRIPELAPPDANIIIEGNLDINLDFTAVLNNQQSETFTYEIYLMDRAGNQSNTVTTSEITVSKP